MSEVQTSINAIRGVVRYVRSSPTRAKQFKTCVEQERITSKAALCLDVPTRWNSTYLMLESALKFQKAFERMEEETQFVHDLKLTPPTTEDWNNTQVLTKFLKCFFDATKTLSASLHVTSNCMRFSKLKRS